MPISEQDLADCLRVLEASRDLDPGDPSFLALERAAAHLRKHAKRKRKAARRRSSAAHDRALRARATLGSEGSASGDSSAGPGGASTLRDRSCYACKQPYRQIHDFYHLLCPACGDASAAKRDQPLTLAGRRVLVTGGRIKIGYACALRCLRAGAEVAVTTRFPADAARRYAAEPDASSWGDRLVIHGLDFRCLPDVLRAIEVWREGPGLDVLINNAAQTVWHPPSHYRALRAGERLAESGELEIEGSPEQRKRKEHRDSMSGAGLAVERWTSPERDSVQLAGVDDAVDLRRVNSWVLRLAAVPPLEMIEAQVVNNIVPFLLASRLLPAFERSSFADRYIVNVAALEGQFQRASKTDRHPHTNMAKAALNMLTRTSAEDYAERGVYMVSVDPGWVSHEGPPEVLAKAEAAGFRPPLDATDAAARILDPIARGLAGRPVWGVLLKDFAEAPW